MLLKLNFYDNANTRMNVVAGKFTYEEACRMAINSFRHDKSVHQVTIHKDGYLLKAYVRRCDMVTVSYRDKSGINEYYNFDKVA